MTLCHKDLHAALLCHLPRGLTRCAHLNGGSLGKQTQLSHQAAHLQLHPWLVNCKTGPGMSRDAPAKENSFMTTITCVMSQAHACDKEVGTSPERELRKPSLRLYSTSHIAKCLIYFAEVFWSTDGSLLSCSSDDVQQRSDVFPWCRETTQSFDNLQVC